MKELIHAMMETDLSKRLSADKAMSRFKSLQEEGLIFQTPSETPAIHRGPEELDEVAAVEFVKSVGMYSLPEGFDQPLVLAY